MYEKTYTVLLFVLTFALPVSGLGYTYLSIVAMMCTYKMPGNAEPSRDQHHLQAKIKVRQSRIRKMGRTKDEIENSRRASKMMKMRRAKEQMMESFSLEVINSSVNKN